MAHRIDAEQDQEVGQTAVISLRPRLATPAPSSRPAARPVVALRPAQEAPKVSRKPIWDKNNVGFWLTVCILISVAFSIIYRALG